MIIQLAQEKHLGAIAGIELQAATQFPPGRLPDVHMEHTLEYERLQQGVQQQGLWVTLSDEVVTGFALMESWQDIALLAEICVLPAFSRRGAGRQLVECCLRGARRRGDRGMGLTTFEDVPWNAPFYHKLGFSIVDERDYPPLRDALEAERASGMTRRVAMFISFL